jgi:hypothetical protein
MNAPMLFADLYARETEYWYEVDHNAGRSAHLLYAEDGRFVIGEKVFNGRAEIGGFYRWRVGQGARTARHVIANPRINDMTSTSAAFGCIMLLYADNGAPVLPSRPAVMIADVESTYRRVGETWELRSRVLCPIFEGGVGATVPIEPISALE